MQKTSLPRSLNEVVQMEIVLASNNKHKVVELEYFINKMCAEKGLRAEEADVLRVTREDLSEQPRLTLMRMRTGAPS